jgi:hypothetical protein
VPVIVGGSKRRTFRHHFGAVQVVPWPPSYAGVAGVMVVTVAAMKKKQTQSAQRR